MLLEGYSLTRTSGPSVYGDLAFSLMYSALAPLDPGR